jgi:membrane-bound serine protease (ClpP class)
MSLSFAALLMFLAVVLLLIEAALPGFGIFGIAGLVLFLFSAVGTIYASPFGAFILIAELLVIALAAKFIWKIIKRKQLHNGIILNDTLNIEKPEFGGLDYFMNKEGVVKIPLKPFGKVDFNGLSVEASSEGGYVGEGDRVKVISVSKNKIVVKRVN